MQKRQFKDYSDQFFKNSLDLLCIATPEGQFMQVNTAWERLLGWGSEELLSRSCLDFVHLDDIELTRSEVAKVAQGGGAVQFENRYLCKNGNYKWLSWHANLDDQTQVILATARDVSESKTVQNFLESAQEMAKIGSWEWDIQRNHVLWSKQQYALFGIHPSTKINYEEYIKHLSPEEKIRTEGVLTRALEGEGEYAIEHEIIRTDGIKRVFFETGKVQFDPLGKAIRMSGTSQDITERIEAQRKLMESEILLSSILNTLPVAVLGKDVRNNFQ